jgi:hypothetical protein
MPRLEPSSGLENGRGPDMARWLITFGMLIVLGTMLWPWLRELGLARLPGDMVVDFIPGISFHLPITTSLLISGVIAGVWALLDR